MVGNCYSVRLPHTWEWYSGNGGLAQVNTDTYNDLEVQGVNWPLYDNWAFKDNTFKYEKDGQIDMMFVFHRGWRPLSGLNPGSRATLFESTQGSRHVVSSGDTIVSGFGVDGSGCTFTPGVYGYGTSLQIPYGPYAVESVVGLICHELGHYHFGFGHCSYGIMRGEGAILGADYRHSPWETSKLGFITPTVVNFSNPFYGLKDFSSRNTGQGEVIQVPINGTNEFFLIASRNRISRYDRIMMGDTTRGDINRIINPDYGIGLYIYHINGGYTYSPQTDQECSDGLYNWSLAGTFIPDWIDPNNPVQQLNYFTRSTVSYNNDASLGSLTNADQKSILYNGEYNWGSEGKSNTILYGDGIDRIYTNNEDIWTGRPWEGDRWDAWKPGYNEVFSPYSSPSTKDWSNNNSGIFIYSTYKNVIIDSIRVYKAGEGGYSLETILQLTPPSRPMGLKINATPCYNDIVFPVITWNHNMSLICYKVMEITIRGTKYSELMKG